MKKLMIHSVVCFAAAAAFGGLLEWGPSGSEVMADSNSVLTVQIENEYTLADLADSILKQAQLKDQELNEAALFGVKFFQEDEKSSTFVQCTDLTATQKRFIVLAKRYYVLLGLTQKLIEKVEKLEAAENERLERRNTIRVNIDKREAQRKKEAKEKVSRAIDRKKAIRKESKK